MGGQIFVGVRTASGVEHIGESWTNWLPKLFAHKDLYEGEGGKPLEELCEYWDHRDSGGFGGRKTRIKNIEYGVVLLDIPSNEIWEHNAYFTPLSWNYSSGDDADNAKFLLGILEQSQYEGLDLYRVGRDVEPHVGTPTPEELDMIQYTARRCARGGGNASGPEEVMGLLTVRLPWARLVHSESNYLRKRKDWNSMIEWLAKRGWKSPVNKTPR